MHQNHRLLLIEAVAGLGETVIKMGVKERVWDTGDESAQVRSCGLWKALGEMQVRDGLLPLSLFFLLKSGLVDRTRCPVKRARGLVGLIKVKQTVGGDDVRRDRRGPGYASNWIAVHRQGRCLVVHFKFYVMGYLAGVGTRAG